MGVSGLTTFIDRNPHLLNKHELRDCSVVIDGNNLYHHIYKACGIISKFGGDYDEYRLKLRINFKSLLKCGVTPYVVLDGGYTTDNKKLKRCLERAKDRVRNVRTLKLRGECRILPLLAYDTFIQTLDELKIAHVTCQYEADCEIAKLANKLQCPVISNDSDFFIFDLTHGFLPLDYLDFNPLYKRSDDGSKSAPFLYCRYYNVQGFIDSFEGLNRAMIPVLATMLGNDYVPPVSFDKINKAIHLPGNRRVQLPSRVSKVMKLIHWLRTCCNDSGDFMDVVKQYVRAQKKFFSSVEGYSDIESFEGIDLLKYFSKDESFTPVAAPSFVGYNGSAFPTWFLLSICKGQITPPIINAAVLHRVIFLTQVEDLKSPSSYLCSEYVRKAIYGILMTSDPVDREEKENASVDLTSQDESSSILSHAIQSVMEKMKPNDDNALAEMTGPGSYDSDKEVNENDAPSDPEMCSVIQQMENCSVEDDADNMEEKQDSNAAEQDDIEILSDCDGEDAPPVLPQVRKQTQFEEYHRDHKNLRKSYLDPLLCLGEERLPTLSDIGDLDKEKRLSLLLRILDMDGSFINEFSENLSLYMISIVTWIRHAKPRFTEHHIDCAILCPILLHMLNPISSLDDQSQRKDQNSSVEIVNVNVNTKSKDSDDGVKEKLNLDAICERTKRLNKNKFYTVRDNLDRYRTFRPVFKRKKGNVLQSDIVHAFAQLQTCMYEISNLNKLLRFPLPSIQPAFFINGSFLYNFYADLITRPVPTNFLDGMVLAGSDIHSAFLRMKSSILEIADSASCLATPVADKDQLPRKKKKGKSKGSKKQSIGEENLIRVGQESENEEEDVTTLEGFDVHNKFSLLLR